MVSVIICTYNPREDYLDRTLASLRAQDLPPAEWELILVDNNSTVPLKEKEAAYVGWHPAGCIVEEAEQGLTAARVCGARQAKGEIIVYVDDDNELAPDYLTTVVKVARDYPLVAVYGPGVVSGEFETKPAPEVEPYLHLLLIGQRERAVWSNIYGDEVNPWGAGMALRRSVLQAFVDYYEKHREACQGLGRKGSALLSAEDHLFTWLATEQGQGKGLFPELSLVHLIPSKRVEPAYLRRLMHGNLLSLARLSSVTGFRPKPPHPLFYLLNCLKLQFKKGKFARQMYQARVQGLKEGYQDIA